MQEIFHRESRVGHTLDDQVIGIPWFEKSQWAGVQKRCSELWLSEKSYGEWRKESKGVMASIKQSGIRVQKVTIDVDRFERWCQCHGCPVTMASLGDFANACLVENGAG